MATEREMNGEKVALARSRARSPSAQARTEEEEDEEDEEEEEEEDEEEESFPLLGQTLITMLIMILNFRLLLISPVNCSD
jgi:uncharacterized membrane protein YdbT with pleckstrin-like domain